jgi:hypothetical protein
VGVPSWVQRCSSALAVAAASLALVIGTGCGAHAHPPALGDGPGSSPVGGGGGGGSGGSGGDAGANLLGDGAPAVPMCDLGPMGGVCACVDQPLLGDPPNLYFVLDRSGSMSEDWGSTGQSKWATVVGNLTQLVVALGPRANFGASVFPNPRSPGDPCAAGAPTFPGIPGVYVLRGDTPAGTVGPREQALISELSGAGAAGGTPTAATLRALAPTIESLPGKTYVIFATDGGPNCNSGAVCTAASCTLNIENTVGCPQAGPNCCEPSPGDVQNLSCLDAQPTIDAVQEIARAGVPVYVIGVPQSEAYATLLDELAMAGGTARGSEPQYYAADGADPAALLTALKKIAAQVTGTCKLALSNAPPDPSLVNVFFDGTPLPQAGPDGWTLTLPKGDAGGESTVTVLGTSCQKILGGDVVDVRVVAGCPTVTL